ncbi:MAG: HAMP domain-containing sensor histidine kinase [Cognaticolwellia sp.]
MFIGALVYQQVLQSKLAVIQVNQDEKLLWVNTEFAKEFSSIKKLTQLLASNDNLKKVDVFKHTVNDEKIRKKINGYFLDFGLVSPSISQIRWLDVSGEERFRINFSKGKGEIVNQDRLQNKVLRDYFKQGISIDAPDSYISKIDLNMEYGVIVTPYEPTLRVTYRTNANDYLVDGLLIINFNLTNLFEKIRVYSSKNAQINIVNQESYWLFSHDPLNEWGFMLGNPEIALSNLKPELWRKILKQKDRNIFRYFDHNIYTLGKLPVFFSKDHKDVLNKDIHIYINSADETLSDIKYSALKYALVCFIIVLSIGAFITYREQRYQQVLKKLFDELKSEKIALDAANQKLSTTIRQQQLLQGSLIEAQKLSSLGLLVAGVAHEMNTPIGGAIISVSNAEATIRRLITAMKSGLTKSELEKSTESIENNLALARVNLDKSVVLVKSFKKMAIDRNTDDIVICRISKVIDNLLVAFHSRLKNSKIKVNPQILSDIDINSRPGVISQVIENLVMNALNHGFKEGDAGEIEIKVENAGSNLVKLTVSDSGVGIEESLQSSIFEPFYTSARGKGNTGLGLYMLFQWVTQVLKGEVKVESEPSSDEHFKTKFMIMLPTNIN